MGRPKRDSEDIYQIKISLVGSRPPIWRRLLVSSLMTLEQLHHAIQISMGWSDSHLHLFRVGEELYGPSDPEDLESRDERTAKLTLLLRNRSKARYTYDFGDDWEHEIIIEEVLKPSRLIDVPACTGGKRQCPPEDCGGLGGFYDLVEAIADPQHKSHRELVEWLGGRFDPEEFSIEHTHRELAVLRKKKRTTPATSEGEPD